ncbi:heme synthase [Haloferax volcanii DS2]|uniref:Protoheme IX farnesyltransferase n=1 Tax=Haloferax volcanii (strain ATCC 29605 / DSM 3757 / JCM 8879 / NBRC 14742 / NCIMB 2012 / VKM B-1768 / DS2) TaxID=309800 RepID=L9URS4_HALVD|nr:heme synthase [Haloferax volcanii DS2]
MNFVATNRDSNTFHGLLAATAMGVYLLLIVGATTALTDATAACSAWPACGDGFSLPATLDGWVALGHRVAAVLVGLLTVATLVSAWWTDTSRRVRATVTASAVLYPAQAGLGAVVATVGVGPALSTLHLVLGMVIFGGLVAALAWTLEAATGDPDDAPVGTPSMSPPADDGERPPVPTDPVARAKATVNAYFRLMKPRLMWLLCLVASAAMALAGTVSPGLTPEVIAATLGGGVLSIGASGTFNHVLERDVDRRMQRTSDRPLAVDLVPVRNAVAFGLLLTVASVALFASVNWLAAVLGVVAIAFYSVVYTLILKPNTVQNTVIGGAAGALPALIGWVAVTGDVGLGGVVLAVVIFMWTPAHFYNLALAYKDDYARGGFPMMPVVRGETETRKHILWWLGATLVAAAGLAVMDALGVVYLVTSILFGGAFLYFVVRLHYERDDTAAFRAFHASNAYLGMLLLAIVVDTLAI